MPRLFPPNPPAKLHFASLEALRFFAFLKVFFFHVPIQLDWPVLQYLKRGGGIGVEFFFVLSGFLIQDSTVPRCKPPLCHPIPLTRRSQPTDHLLEATDRRFSGIV